MADRQSSEGAIGIDDFLRDHEELEASLTREHGRSKEGEIPRIQESSEPFRLVTLVGGYRHKEVEGRRQMTELGDPAILLLLAYLLTLPGIVMEFFMLKGLWYFGFELYRTYIFLLSTGCVALGFYMIFKGGETLKVRKEPVRSRVFYAGICIIAIALVSLLLIGRESDQVAIGLSVVIVASVIAVLATGPSMPKRDVYPVAGFGAGAIIVALVPVNHAFDIWSGVSGVAEFTLFDGLVVVIGVSVAFVALNSVRSQRGLFSCWLIGAMVIALIAFHELVGINASGTFEIYDQILALEGSVFSIIPLAMYFIREFDSARLWTHVLNARSLLERKSYESALVEIEKGVEIASRTGLADKLALPWSVYGDIYYSMGRLNRARACYDMALRIDPNDAETWSNLGNMLSVKGFGDQALEAYRKATAISPDDPQVWNNLGVVLLSLKRRDEALAAFEKAISKDASYPMAYYNAGLVLQRTGKPVAAARLLERLVSLAPDDEHFRRAYRRAEVVLEYYQQVAGWRLLGADISEMIKTLLGDPGKFEDDYQEFIGVVLKELSQNVFGGDRAKTEEALRNLLAKTHDGRTAVLDLRSGTGMSMDELRFTVAMLIHAGRARFRTIDNEVRFVPTKEAQAFGRSVADRIAPQQATVSQRKPSFM